MLQWQLISPEVAGLPIGVELSTKLTGLFIDVYGSVDLLGIPDRAWRTWDPYAYVQDDYKVTSRLTLNLGLRYEHIGAIANAGGCKSNFDPELSDRNSPATGRH